MEAVDILESYRTILVSAVGERGGMALELDLLDGTQIAEVFEASSTGQRTVHLFVDSVPLEAIEWMLKEADQRL